MISYWLIVCHLVGDYVLQSDWMALEKANKTWPAFMHAATYTLPFALFWWLLDKNPQGLLVVYFTHFFIDRYRLARHICWAKNFLAPEWIDTGRRETGEVAPGRIDTYDVRLRNHPWSDCSGTGYHEDRPAWLTVWLMIIADNTMHLICNGLALEFLS